MFTYKKLANDNEADLYGYQVLLEQKLVSEYDHMAKCAMGMVQAYFPPPMLCHTIWLNVQWAWYRLISNHPWYAISYGYVCNGHGTGLFPTTHGMPYHMAKCAMGNI